MRKMKRQKISILGDNVEISSLCAVKTCQECDSVGPHKGMLVKDWKKTNVASY